MNEENKALFIDRDGVLNEMVYDVNHGLLDSPRRPEQLRVMPGAGDFLRQVREMGYAVIVVTNQPGIAKGTLTVNALDELHEMLARELARQGGGGWDALYYCPHHPDGGPWKQPEYVMKCDCRKPAPGMLLHAAAEHGIALARSWMLGDGLTDVQAGRAAGCRTLLLTRLKVNLLEKCFDLTGREPDCTAADFDAALACLRGASS